MHISVQHNFQQTDGVLLHALCTMQDSTNFYFLIRRRLAQNTSFFMSLSAAMGNSFFHDGWNFRIPPSSYFLTFSLSCFCSQGDSGFLLLPIFHRSSKLATTVHNGSETRQSDLTLSPTVFR